MTFEDTIQIEVKFGCGFAIVNDKAFAVDNGEIKNEVIDYDITKRMHDENMNPIDPYTEFRDFSKCFISFNSAAQKVRLNDGQEYVPPQRYG